MEEDKLRRQEYYRKFYTDLNDMRIEMGLPPKKYHLDLLEDEVFSRTIFVKIHNQTYSISYEELNQVFSRFGILDDVVIFSHGNGFHSKICFSSKESMIRAFEFLNGRNIYDDCCTLELILVQENFDAQMNSHGANPTSATSADATPAVIDATWSHDVPKSASSPIDLEAAYVEEREPTPICLEVDETNLEEFAEVDSCSCSPVAMSCEQQLAELPPPTQILSHFGVPLDAEAKSILQGEICEVLPSSEIGIVLALASSAIEEDANLFNPCNTSGSQHENRQRQVEFLQPNLSSTPLSSEWNLQANFERQCDEGLCSSTEDQEFDGLQASTVILDSLIAVSEIVSVETGQVYDAMTDWTKIRADSCRAHSKEFLVNFPAHKVFVEMPEKKLTDIDDSIEVHTSLGDVFGSIYSIMVFAFDPGKAIEFSMHGRRLESLVFVFDPGIVYKLEYQPTSDPLAGDAFGSVQSRSFPFDPGKHFELHWCWIFRGDCAANWCWISLIYCINRIAARLHEDRL